MEQDDEWTVAERRYFSAESMKQLSIAGTTRDRAGDSCGDCVKRIVWRSSASTSQ